VSVLAVVVVGGSRDAVLDALTPVGGVPMVVRSVRAVLASGVTDRVLLAAAGHHDALRSACAGLPVDVQEPAQVMIRARAHTHQRPVATIGDGVVTAGFEDVVLVHDVARPLAPPALFRAVVAAVRSGHDVAVPVLPLADTVKLVDGAGLVRGTPDRTGLRVVQTPHALGCVPVAADAGLLGVAGERAAAGRVVHAVEGDPLAFAVRSAWDLELAELLVERTPPWETP
jgi:2-C-methyl-D-erythritol 4-phosphate cytidylyltransferase